jgi:hypothetical protein
MRIRIQLLIASFVLAPVVARAQFYSYPSFQVPRISVRDYTFAITNAGASGTALLFQWREGFSDASHLTLDAGLADPDAQGANALFIIGGSVAYRARKSTGDLPLDMVVTTGIGGAFGDSHSFIRLPIGLSVGHRFELDSPMALTFYAHPRLAFDYCSDCSPSGRRDTSLGVDADLGVAFEVSSKLSFRASALLAGSDFFGHDNGFGLSLTWTPTGIR